MTSPKYLSKTGWELGYRWAIISRKTGRSIMICKTLEEAVRKEKGYHYLGKKYKRTIVAIQPDNIEE